VNKIRSLQGQYKAEERKSLESLTNLSVSPGATREETAQQAIARQNEFRQRYEMLRLQYEQVFRTSIMSDAAYCRRELLSRIGGDEFLRPGERVKAIAIDGIMAGVDPIGEAADYLDALARKLAR
jgi:hypothetical protein